MTDTITLARENERLLALNADLKRQLDDWRDAHGLMHKAHAELEQRQARFIAAARAWNAIRDLHNKDHALGDERFEEMYMPFMTLMDAAAEGFDGE